MKRFLYLAIAAVTAMSTMGCDGYYGPMRGGWNHMMNYGYGCGFGGMFMWILFVIIIGVVVYFILHNTKLKNSGGTTEGTPLDILKKRYAKGEITKEEYERMKKDVE
jgi:putative membrane protein